MSGNYVVYKSDMLPVKPYTPISIASQRHSGYQSIKILAAFPVNILSNLRPTGYGNRTRFLFWGRKGGTDANDRGQSTLGPRSR